MKKISRSLEQYFGPVKLYKNDVEEIVTILKESYIDSAEREREIEIAIGDFELSSIEELAEIKDKSVRYMRLDHRIHDPYVRTWLSINEERVYLSCSDNSPTSLGVFTTIETLLSSRRRKWNWLSQVTWFLTASATSAAIFVVYGQVNKIPFFTYMGYSLAGLLLIFGLLSFFTRSFRKSEIILASHYEQTTFWERNKDKLLVALITGLISFALGIIGTILVQSIMATP